MAFIFSTAWDNIIASNGVWTFDRACMVGQIFSIPYEEYAWPDCWGGEAALESLLCYENLLSRISCYHTFRLGRRFVLHTCLAQLLLLRIWSASHQAQSAPDGQPDTAAAIWD